MKSQKLSFWGNFLINTVCRKCHGMALISELTFCRGKNIQQGKKCYICIHITFFRKLSVHLSADIYSCFFHTHCRLFCENTIWWVHIFHPKFWISLHIHVHILGVQVQNMKMVFNITQYDRSVSNGQKLIFYYLIIVL